MKPAAVKTRAWPCVPLGQLLEAIEAGKSPQAQERPASATEIGVLKVSAVTWGQFKPLENKAVLPGYDPGDCPRVRKGDLFISRANTLELVGAVVMADEDYPNLMLSDKILRLVPNLRIIDPRYLLYALRTRKVKAHLMSNAGGTSGSMRNVSQAAMKLAPIVLPPMIDQKRIADVLSTVESIRTKRGAAIALVPALVESKFLELFGHPSTNRKGFAKLPLQEVANIARGRFSPRPRNDPQYYGGQYPFIQTGDVVRAGLYVTEHTQTLNEKGLKVSKQFPSGTIAITIAANIGETAILTYDTCFPDSVVGLQCFKNVMLPEFLRFQLQLLKARLVAGATQTAQKNINVETLKSLMVTVPPIELQRQFVHEVSRLESVASAMATQNLRMATLLEVLQENLFSAGSALPVELTSHV